MKLRTISFLAALVLVLAGSSLSVLGQETVEEHIAAARTAAGQEHTVLFEALCATPPPAPLAQPSQPSQPAQPAQPASPAAQPQDPPDRAQWHADPVKVFDNLYYVGQTEYSAWAVTTSEGIIIIDPIFEYSVENEIVDGLTTLGFDPATIKYVIVSHGHRDHVGGARYLQDRFGARVIMGAADWDLLDRNTQLFPKPRRDLVATDGQKLVLGDTALTLYVTPGHTLGTICTVLPVRDGESSHVAALWGGTAFNWLRSVAYITPETPPSFWFRSYISSAERFRDIAAAAGADVLLSNHPQYDGSVTKLPAMSERRSDESHPYVIGTESVQRFLTVAAECAKAGLARLGK